MTSIALYPIYASDIAPHYTMQRAFEEQFFPCYTYDWYKKSQSQGIKAVHKEFVELVKAKRPDYAFMQIQGIQNMDVETIREISKYTKVLHWSGDVRTSQPWYDWLVRIGKEVHLSLFTNEHDVHYLRARGCKADFFQIGYDENWYFPGPYPAGPEIVFSANNYPNFPLSDYRLTCAKHLHEHFGHRFAVNGAGWPGYLNAKQTNAEEDGRMYQRAKIGISISNLSLERYHSDRLLRIMGSGIVPMSHRYPGIEKDYRDGHDIVIFDSPKDLVDQCEHYLANYKDWAKVANGAYTRARHYRWSERVRELQQIIDIHE